MSPPYNGGWLGWLKAQAALLPLIIVCGSAALALADGRYMVREEDGEDLTRAMEEIRANTAQIKIQQAINTNNMAALKQALEELKAAQIKIDDKLNRLIERESGH